ncbi:MAG: hypothetical protein LCH67_07875 [Bacteroidetes bacterium]|nr:hypothetical protein [Bacteroidota bacterium]
MDTCFVIQPFDKDKFDQRYSDVFEPAIKAAGLEPYRVDRDPTVTIPIERIEEGIKTARICFAEITLDNPNVWYELGFAFAIGKDVVMITEERQKFPFDIQHRQIINYKTTSKSEYEKLEIAIKEKLVGLIGKQKSVNQILENPIKESKGIKPHELTMMLLIMENQLTREDSVSLYYLKSDMDKAGYNALAVSISVRELQSKGFIETFKEFDYQNNEFLACRLTESGEKWLIDNQSLMQFRNERKSSNEASNDVF